MQNQSQDSVKEDIWSEIPELGFMGPEEIKAWETYPLLKANEDGLRRAEQRMKDIKEWSPHQLLGRRWPIACVALEITQRCNLDCTLCYLSERSEEVKDIPLEEVYRRIEMIHQHYGDNTDVQVTGGDPTLRKREELMLIIKRIRSLNMRPSLFTNGIKCTRDLIVEMVDNGLIDIAFHVDITQERKGYTDEKSLNKVRLEYINRARGLPVSIFFNTTVHAENFNEIPDVVKFFSEHTDVVRLASFQLQADTGRGVLREREFLINPDTVSAQIEKGVGTKLSFDVPLVGHPKCNRYAMALEVNGRMFDMFDEKEFVRNVFVQTADQKFDRRKPMKAVASLFGGIAANPKLGLQGVGWLARKAWAAKTELVKSGGKARKLSFFIHNFMDAQKLDRDRCHGCVFMTMTSEGPVSMCVHNAKRDDFILKPFKVKTQDGQKIWNPLTGQMGMTEAEAAAAKIRPAPPKGRAKETAMAQEET